MSVDTQGDLRHWLAYRERWQDAPKVITPRDDDDVAEWRQLGYQVEGPFVLEAEAGAVSLLDDLSDVLADVQAGVVPADGSIVRDVLKRAVNHVNGGQ